MVRVSRTAGAWPSAARVSRGRGFEIASRRIKKVEDSVARLLRAPPYAAKRKDLGLCLVTAHAATATRALLSLATMLMAR